IVIEKVATKIFGGTIGKATAGAAPIVGQIYMGLQFTDLIDRLDTAVKDNILGKYAADLSSKQYLDHYASMRTMNDELKDGELSWQETQAIHDTFEGAETSKVFRAMTPANQNALASFINPRAYAQEASDEEYTC